MRDAEHGVSDMHDTLIETDAWLLRPHTTTTGRLIGDVAAAVVSSSGVPVKNARESAA
jgi:hypothetical protein